jgi:GT2 family glycosyltransferase
MTPDPKAPGLLTELHFLSFYLPRQGVQWLASRLPLSQVRDRLPRIIGNRLRSGLYPARITEPQGHACERRHLAWGEPAELNPQNPIRLDGPPRASILLVTYNNLDLTRLCLRSLQQAAGSTPFEIVALDNHSADGTADYLAQVERSGLLPLRLVRSPKNLGFAAGNNRAAAEAAGDVLVFLNNDTVVTSCWLERLVDTLDRDPTVGLVGPVTNSCGNEAQLGTPYQTLPQMEHFAAEYKTAHAGQQADLPMLTLFCAAMPRALYQKLGGLDESYGVGLFEDDDLSYAVKRSGRRVVLCRDAFVHHYGGAAFSRLPPARYLRLFWENRRHFEKKWHTTWQKR